MHTRLVGVGLNISAPVKIWSNFRGGKNDWRLKELFNKTEHRGFYLTDIIKNEVQPNSKILIEKINSGHISIRSHLDFFIEEMKQLKITDETVFILFGGSVNNIFNQYFKVHFPKNKVIHVWHYSYAYTTNEAVFKKIKSQLKEGGIDLQNNDDKVEEKFHIQHSNESMKSSKVLPELNALALNTNISQEVIDTARKIVNYLVNEFDLTNDNMKLTPSNHISIQTLESFHGNVFTYIELKNNFLRMFIKFKETKPDWTIRHEPRENFKNSHYAELKSVEDVDNKVYVALQHSYTTVLFRKGIDKI